MILSMTGFGKAATQLPGKKITCEIRSLNSKQTDINLRIPSAFREKEMPLRNLVAQTLNRGKIDVSIYLEITGEDEAPKINMPVVLGYIKQLKQLEEQADIHGDALTVAMRMPDVLKSSREELSAEDWKELQNVVVAAMDNLMAFRAQEGASLADDFTGRIEAIKTLLTEVPKYEEERIETVKARFEKNLENVKFDQDRFEQELIFYIEKLDINEEKVRLANHLDYFLEVMNGEDLAGKKLGFICQEIGREINTLGSKANHAELQKIVVQMKEELERMKEQVLNTL